MLSLKSKTCTNISISLLVLCIALTIFFPSINYNDDGTRIRIMFCIWLFGGLSLIFSTKINSKCLKAIVIVSNLICIFNWIIFGW
ncbi:hypothetical protein A5814_000575 [Enterococcus faecium]|nr:hypothetical protein A5814_000575 [Enterococcus faecium]